MKFIFPFFFFFFSIFSFSQDLKSFDKIYNKTFLETSNKDLKYAIIVADSLYKTSKTPLFKSRSLLLSATLYKQAGDIKKAIEYGLKSLNTIKGTGNYEQETKIYGFLATQNRLLKFHTQSSQYLDKAISASTQIKDPEISNKLTGLILQEKAYEELDRKNYEKSIEYLNSSQKYFDLLKIHRNFYSISNQHLLGNSYYELNDLKNATLHYENALQLSKNEPETFITGLIYNGLALIAIKKKDAFTAKKYIDLAEKAYKNSQFLELKSEIYETSKLYFELTNDLENLLAIQKKKEALDGKIMFKYREYIIDSYTSLQRSVKKGQEEISIKNKLIILCIILLALGSIIFYLSKLRQQKKLLKFRKIIADLDEKIKRRTLVESQIIVEDCSMQEQKTEQKSSNEDPTLLIGAKTQQKIIKKLQKFENNILFTQKNMSLPTLATYCGTNIKYLSYIIKNEKDKDFTGYINNLRISYIICKLKNDKKYRKYKIAVLAEEAGYSSPNKFATIFKNITSFPPSVFIKYLEEEQK